MAQLANVYSQLIEKIFFEHYRPTDREVSFERAEIIATAQTLKIKLPKNLGDVLYTFRYRAELPQKIVNTAPEGFEWVIRSTGTARYKFALAAKKNIIPSASLGSTKILDSTPGVISKYALTDEQSLLAKLRYNRLIDVFTGLTCYSLQNHLRTSIKNIGQVEIDELYIGIDRNGAQYVIPVQAKGAKDKIGVIQIEQDFAACAAKFPELICVPIAAQFMSGNVIALFRFRQNDEEISASLEQHYRLVRPDELSNEELAQYRAEASLFK